MSERSTNDLCRCGHTRIAHAGIAGGCLRCITPSGGTNCWHFRVPEESAGVSKPDLDIDAIEARANAATPGPWTKITGRHDPQVMAYGGEVPLADFRGGSDAIFAAHARTDVPALVAEVRRLRAENNRARAMFHNPMAVEREACAKVALSAQHNDGPAAIAAAIRGRGEG